VTAGRGCASCGRGVRRLRLGDSVYRVRGHTDQESQEGAGCRCSTSFPESRAHAEAVVARIRNRPPDPPVPEVTALIHRIVRDRRVVFVLVDDQAAIHSTVPADVNDIEFDSAAVQMQATGADSRLYGITVSNLFESSRSFCS
jgi:hypothetical protein